MDVSPDLPLHLFGDDYFSKLPVGLLARFQGGSILWLDDFNAEFGKKTLRRLNFVSSVNLILQRIEHRFSWNCHPASVRIFNAVAKVEDRWSGGCLSSARLLRHLGCAGVRFLRLGQGRGDLVSNIFLFFFFECFFGGSKGSLGMAHMGEKVIFQSKTIVLGWLLLSLPFPAEVCPGSLPRLEWLRVHGEHRWILQDRYWRHSHWRTIHPGLHGDCVVWRVVRHHLCHPETHRPECLGPPFRMSWQSFINLVAVGFLSLLCSQAHCEVLQFTEPSLTEKNPCLNFLIQKLEYPSCFFFP